MQISRFGKEERKRSFTNGLTMDMPGSRGVTRCSLKMASTHWGTTIERFPEAEFYQYLQSPQLQWVFASSSFQKGEAESDPSHLCASPAWNCTDFIWQPPLCRNGTMRCLGQVLHDYPHYSQGVIEQQIANNGLPLSTVYLTRLSKQIAIWNAWASKKDILVKHHYPSEGVDGVPRSAFVPIQFSPKRYGCNATETATPEGGFSCRLEAKRLLKVASPRFMDSGDARYFAERFSLNSDDYDRLFDLWRHYDGDAYSAACSWLKEKGSLKWGSWIRFSKQVRFIREFPPVDGCFPTFYFFMISALTVAFVHQVLPSCFRACKGWCTRSKSDNPNWEPTDLSDIQRRMNDRANYTLPDFTSKLVACRSSSFVEVKMALLRGSMGFMSFFRDEEDFCYDPGKAMLPPRASSCFRQYFQTSLQVLVYILTSGLAHIAVSALIFALATGMVGALLAEVRATMEKNKQVDPLLQVEDWYTTWLSKMQTITVLMDDFKFLPTFFITYMIGQDVSRWLQVASNHVQSARTPTWCGPCGCKLVPESERSNHRKRTAPNAVQVVQVYQCHSLHGIFQTCTQYRNLRRRSATGPPHCWPA